MIIKTIHHDSPIGISNVVELYSIIRSLEHYMGEDFLDQNESLCYRTVDKHFLRWLLNNNEITAQKYESMMNVVESNYLGYDEEDTLLMYAECEEIAYTNVYYKMCKYAMEDYVYQGKLIKAILSCIDKSRPLRVRPFFEEIAFREISLIEVQSHLDDKENSPVVPTT